MRTLTTGEKGGIAELKIAARANQLGYGVSRPLTEGLRYDLIFDAGERLLRVQCKWASRKDDVVVVCMRTCRFTPARGHVRTVYSPEEVDVIVAYCEELDECYLLPIDDFIGQSYLYLRLRPTRNNQLIGVKWAEQYRLGAVAQLEERRAGSA